MGILDRIFKKDKKVKAWISSHDPAEDNNQQDLMAQIPEAILGKIGNTTRPKRKVNIPVLSYSKSNNQGRFEESEYDLSEIARAADTEAYVRLSFDQLKARILREPWQLKGRNDATVAYIMKRIREMEVASNKTFNNLLRQITNNLVQYSNAFIIKTRSSEIPSSGSPVTRYGRPLVPVVGMFSADPTSMEVRRDERGNIIQWRQFIPGKGDRTFRRENVVHIAYDRRDGFAFGTPWVVPVLDDIRALRRLEELVEMLVSRHIFPLYHYTVGTESMPAEVYDNGMSEVDTVRAEVEYMPAEGAIVTPERHKVEAISPDPMDTKPYLDYFEARVLTGLRISNVDSGRGNTSNKATAGFLRAAKDDLAKDMQDVLKDYITAFVFDEWLEEGKFPLTEDNRVHLWWPPVDPVEQREKELHALQLFQSNAITETELRMIMGLQGITDQQREEMWFEMYTQPEAELEQRFKLEQQAQMAKLKVQNQPTNQSGTTTRGRTTANDKNEDLTEEVLMYDHMTEDLTDCGCCDEDEEEVLDNISFGMGSVISSIIDNQGEAAIDMSIKDDGLDRDVIIGYYKKFKDAKLSTAQRKKLKGKVFCGPERSFPVNDCAHYTAALRLIGRYKGPGDKSKIRACIMRRGRKLGCKSASKKDTED